MPEEVNSGRYWTVNHIADDLGVAVNTVYGYHARGILKMERILGVLAIRDGNYQQFKAHRRAVYGGEAK